MSELLPCPFCGGEADIERTEERFEYGTGGPNSVMEFGYYTYCTRCDASIGLINVPTSDRDMAIHEWNRRTPPTPTVPLPDEVAVTIGKLVGWHIANHGWSIALGKVNKWLDAQSKEGE